MIGIRTFSCVQWWYYLKIFLSWTNCLQNQKALGHLCGHEATSSGERSFFFNVYLTCPQMGEFILPSSLLVMEILFFCASPNAAKGSNERQRRGEQKASLIKAFRMRADLSFMLTKPNGLCLFQSLTYIILN